MSRCLQPLPGGALPPTPPAPDPYASGPAVDFLHSTRFAPCTTSAGLYAAVADPSVDAVLVGAPLVLNASDWASGTAVRVGRNLAVIGNSPDSAVITLDFNSLANIIEVAPGVTLTFQNLELVNHQASGAGYLRMAALAPSPGSMLAWQSLVSHWSFGPPPKQLVAELLSKPYVGGGGGNDTQVLWLLADSCPSRATQCYTSVGGGSGGVRWQHQGWHD